MKIALVLNDNFTMWRFRRGLIETLVQRGFVVHAITPPGEYTSQIESLGAKHIAVPMSRFVSPILDALTILRLLRVFRRERYDIVHNMQIKPAIFGSFAARLAGVQRVVALLPGLGYPFFVPDPSMRQRLLGRLVLEMLRRACSLTDRVWFQNRDDYAMFVDRAFIGPTQGVVIRGSGVDVTEFCETSVDVASLPALSDELRVAGGTRLVTMVVARLIWSKGVREFLAAAKLISGQRSDVQFVLAGPFEPDHPDAVPPSYFASDLPGNVRVLTGFRTDIRELLHLSDVVVLPSYFREGVPRVLIEALALGKPIVTTDRPGCREVVDDGQNGFLVPAHDAAALSHALLQILGDESLRLSFGRASRRKAVAEFDERMVVGHILTSLYGV